MKTVTRELSSIPALNSIQGDADIIAKLKEEIDFYIGLDMPDEAASRLKRLQEIGADREAIGLVHEWQRQTIDKQLQPA